MTIPGEKPTLSPWMILALQELRKGPLTSYDLGQALAKQPGALDWSTNGGMRSLQALKRKGLVELRFREEGPDYCSGSYWELTEAGKAELFALDTNEKFQKWADIKHKNMTPERIAAADQKVDAETRRAQKKTP